MKILFVCHGNVARSQMAEAFYNHFTESTDAWSAGTHQRAPERYNPLPKVLFDIMEEMGVSMEGQYCKYVTQEMIDKSDKIYILCKEDLCPDFLLNSNKKEFWTVEDPYGMSTDGIKKIRDLIKEKVLSIIRT
ncbi:arsenate reductase ArsC [Candidatus Woesearchaeota archaeon]|nr:arsenate reductase ArsC [Candidatus Woesearchaeota archaeon]